jgi:hypothetical protein
MSGVVDSRRKIRHGNIDANDPDLTPTVRRSMRNSVGLDEERPAILMSTATMSAIGLRNQVINNNADVSALEPYCIAGKCVVIKDHISLAIWGLTLAQFTSIHQASG